MNRRQLLKLLASGVVGLSSNVLDVDRLLWVPGAKTIFLPTDEAWLYKPTDAQILAQEIARITPYLKGVFERDDYFYSRLAKGDKLTVKGNAMSFPLTYEEKKDKKVRVPLIINPGDIGWDREE